MQIPKFNPSNNFLGDTDLPCLLAKVKNSALPGGIATRYIKSYKKDPICKIYLRGKDPEKITAWHQQILKRLFVQAEWIPSIAQDLKRTEIDFGEEYLSCGLEKAEMRDLKEHGLLPFFAINTIAIDDIKRKVFMSVDTSMVDEHGLAIYLSKDRWRLGDWDHFSRYSHGFDAQREARDEKKGDQRQKEWDVRWAGFFPIPKPGDPVESDMSVLLGEWVYDRQLTAQVLKKVGESKDFIEKALMFGGSYSKYRISKNEVKEITAYTDGTDMTTQVSRCERHGSRVTIEGTREIKLGNKGKKHTLKNVLYLCCYRDRLVTRGGYDVFRRVVKADPKG